MTTKYTPYGTTLQSEQTDVPQPLCDLASACETHVGFDVHSFRKLTDSSYAVVVDVGDGTVDSGNSVGIRRRERLALCYVPDGVFPWEARALRTDFPLTMHQNHVRPGEPRSLCLYMESWSTVERSWTPQQFLSRVLWWLRETANENLHRADQPLEQLFFESPLRVVLPEDHFERLNDPSYRLKFLGRAATDTGITSLLGFIPNPSTTRDDAAKACYPLSVLLPPVTHGVVEEFPQNLRELIEKLAERAGDVSGLFRDQLRSLFAEGTSLPLDPSGRDMILLIIGVPLQRSGEPESTAVYGFLITDNLGRLGEALGAFFKAPGQREWYIDPGIGTLSRSPDLRSLERFRTDPVSIRLMPSKDQIRCYSGISDCDSSFRGIIAGLGSLGGAMAEIWAREAWGEWDYVDPDVVEPHNLPRHISPAEGVGVPKAHLISGLVETMFTVDHALGPVTNAHNRRLTADTEWLTDVLEHKDLVVDVSTTIEVPRDLSGLDRSARVASAFMTPSGRSSVLLMEDQSGYIRSLSLEAQYYRAILDNDVWGEHHLDGNKGHFSAGAGCRDITVALSNELVSLHAALLARQLRRLYSEESAQIRIWDHDDASGAVTPHTIPIASPVKASLGEWTVWWDTDVEQCMSSQRADALPNETGGVLLGFVDHKIKSIAIVLAMKAPEDSLSTPHSFARGVEGLLDQISECHRRTGRMVSYIGEWHSHPASCSSEPSSHDRRQLQYLTDAMAEDGAPAIALIISERSITVSLEAASTTIDLS